MRHDPVQYKTKMRAHRQRRIRRRIWGTAERPRLSVYRSSKHMVLQLIDDETHKTLAAVRTRRISKKTKTECAREAAKELAAQAKTRGIGKVVFDRGGYLYHGRVKAVAEEARGGGLQF